jgi:glycerophosphoryl diester phosphodiesterase
VCTVRADRSKRWPLLVSFTLILGVVYVTNQSSSVPPVAGAPKLLAHRGVHQTFSPAHVTDETCTARQIDPPSHPFLENTLASMRAAFDAGADRVEIDVQNTRDGHFAVFHDADLECRTDGRGAIQDHSIADLKRLDVGHGYTADGGATFPFRGRGRGLMPSLAETLEAFPQHRFVIHLKTNHAQAGVLLAQHLQRVRPAQLANLAFVGGDLALDALEASLPSARAASRSALQACILRYAALGWSGYVPQACRDTLVLIPMDVAPFLWGWPHRLQRRLASVGSELVVKGPIRRGSGAIDSLAQVQALPADFAGTIWTNRIQLMQRWKTARKR